MERVAWAISGIGFFILLYALSMIPTASEQTERDTVYDTQPGSNVMIVRSPAFNHEETIPSKYTCEGEDISPPLAFDAVPPETVSFVLIMDDPDAPMGTWTHWIRFNIPATQTRLGEGEEPQGVGSVNSWGKAGYGGPCPPSGEHRYLFKLYALDTLLDVPEEVTKEDLLVALEGHVLESTTLVGLYTKHN